jgi:peptide deformylase
MPLRVTQYGEPVLRKSGVAVSTFDPGLRRLANEMIETMYEAEGIGLAAQQVGETIQLCVVDVTPPEGQRPDFHYELDGKTPPLDLIMPLVLINPEVEPLASMPGTTVEEGCLSFPDIRGMVERPGAIHCRFQDLDGASHILFCDGLLARCIQHEADHLNGVLFIDRMDTRSLRKVETRIKKLKRETRDFLRKES